MRIGTPAAAIRTANECLEEHPLDDGALAASGRPLDDPADDLLEQPRRGDQVQQLGCAFLADVPGDAKIPREAIENVLLPRERRGVLTC